MDTELCSGNMDYSLTRSRPAARAFAWSRCVIAAALGTAIGLFQAACTTIPPLHPEKSGGQSPSSASSVSSGKADKAAADDAYRNLAVRRPLPLVTDMAALESYNLSVRAIATRIHSADPDTARTRLATLGIALRIPDAGKNLPPRKLYLADPSPGSLIPGAGVPVVIEYATSEDGHYPVEGFFQGATAVYRPASASGHSSSAVLDLIPNTKATVNLAGHVLPLARDVSADGLMLVKRAERLRRLGFSGMIRPDIKTHRQQIYLLDPYDPNKIPLLMVHGLQSTPVDFAQLVNSLRQDPEIRARYQIWQFYYTSGTPVLLNALHLRESLDKLVRDIDPDGRHPAMRRIVVLGHSMGGVISHTLVCSSQNKLWDSIFRVPPDQLKGNREDISQLHSVMTFRRNPRVVRAIFVSAPHRGSPVANSLAGIIGNLLVSLPRSLRTGFTQIAEQNPDKMTPAALRFYRDGRFSSIRTLSPKSTALRALAEIPPEVPFNTIVGQKHAGPAEKGSDGVVPYTSSHLAGAESELIVRGGHVTFRYPEAVAEIKRILHKEAALRR